jgi:transcriptional regulator with XRE-family HTH domain
VSRGSELFRDAKGTQGEKARVLGLAQQYVSQLCNGKRTPSDELKGKIEKTYGVARTTWDEAGGESRSEDAPRSGPRGDDLTGPLIPDAPVAEQARALLRWLVSKTALTSEQKNLVAELRQVMAMEAKSSPLEAHPDFAPWVDGLLDALQGVPGALDALDAHLSRTAPARKAA